MKYIVCFCFFISGLWRESETNWQQDALIAFHLAFDQSSETFIDVFVIFRIESFELIYDDGKC